MKKWLDQIAEKLNRKTWISLTVTFGCVMTVAVTVLRICLTPLMRDADTGRFSLSYAVIAAIGITVILLACLAVLIRAPRLDIGGQAAVPFSLTSVFSGAVIALAGAADAIRWIVSGTAPTPGADQAQSLGLIASVLMLACGIGGGIVLVRFGLQVTTEGGTRRGMHTWGLLLLVLWAWFRLARYEMSYASAVGLTTVLYDFLMLIAELLFLFKFARFVSGIGKAGTGNLLFYAMSTVVLTLSGTLTRVGLYLTGDAESYQTVAMAGLSDFAVGVFALVLALSLIGGHPESSEPPEEIQQ